MRAPTVTALIEIGGFRFLTDPTFDGPGEYRLPYVTLTKTSRPAIALSDIGPIDAVLLSHDQHAENPTILDGTCSARRRVYLRRSSAPNGSAAALKAWRPGKR